MTVEAMKRYAGDIVKDYLSGIYKSNETVSDELPWEYRQFALAVIHEYAGQLASKRQNREDSNSISYTIG